MMNTWTKWLIIGLFGLIAMSTQADVDTKSLDKYLDESGEGSYKPPYITSLPEK